MRPPDPASLVEDSGGPGASEHLFLSPLSMTFAVTLISSCFAVGIASGVLVGMLATYVF
jgi:hypothetical protein